MGNCLSNKKNNEYLPVSQVQQVPPSYTYGMTNNYPIMTTSPVSPPPLPPLAGSNSDPKSSVEHYRASTGWNDPPSTLFNKRA